MKFIKRKNICFFFIMINMINLMFSTYADLMINKMLNNFLPFDLKIDNNSKDIFTEDEKEMFDVFNRVKNPNGIAIDLSSNIGKTSCWLSKNFYYVLSVGANPYLLNCIKNNLNNSKCSNVSICERPIFSTCENLIFGPINKSNQIVSCIKPISDNINDVIVKGITLKQLIHDYIYKNQHLQKQKISFINCDIEGAEEEVIEDILYFAYYNKCKVYISFHLDCWKNTKVEDFAYLFKFFKTNIKEDICVYLKQNTLSSVLFEPLELKEPLIKKNITVVIIGFNFFTYISNMVKQLEKYTKDIIIVDNASSYPPLLDYYKNYFKYTLLRQERNYGHSVYLNDFIQNLVGDVYILTDPDLKFNENLPKNFIQMLLEISNYFKAHRVGFALCIDPHLINLNIKLSGMTILEIERGYWQHKTLYPSLPELEIYWAPIDTTFCLINKTNINPGDPWYTGQQFRVAGNFTCFHLPWAPDFKRYLLPGEYEHYTSHALITSTSWTANRLIKFSTGF